MVRGSWSMDKKILILGSICAVVILIGVSFSSVVGFQSNEASSKRVSPLFNVRTKNILNENNLALTCGYVGKDKGNTVYIPILDNTRALLIDRLRRLDNTAFNKFITLIINQANKGDEFEDLDVSKILDALYLIREKPDIVKNMHLAERDYIQYDIVFPTMFGDWYFGCLIGDIAWILRFIYVTFWFTLFILASMLSCEPPTEIITDCNQETCEYFCTQYVTCKETLCH